MMALKSKTDEEIVEQVRNNNPQVYEEIIYRYENKLIRYAQYLTQDTEISKDVVQDALVKAYENLQSFDTKRKFSSWIYRIVHNQAINVLKKRKREITGKFDLFENVLSQNESVEENYETESIKKMVHSCLQKIPVKYSEPLVLFFLEEKSYEEISDILKMPVGTVGTRINRGKKLLGEKCKDANGK